MYSLVYKKSVLPDYPTLTPTLIFLRWVKRFTPRLDVDP